MSNISCSVFTFRRETGNKRIYPLNTTAFNNIHKQSILILRWVRSISFKHFLNNNIVTSNFKTWKYLISDVCNFPIKIWHNLFIFSFWDRVKKKIYPLTKWDLKSSYISHNFLNFDYQQIIKHLYWGKSIEIPGD